MSENKHYKFCLTALVLGIISLFLGWIPFFGWSLVVITIIIAILGLHHTNIREKKNIAVIGIVLAILGFIAVPVVFEATVSSGWIDVNSLISDRTDFSHPFVKQISATITSQNTISFSVLNKGPELLLTGKIISSGDCSDAYIINAKVNNNLIKFNKTIINRDEEILFEIKCSNFNESKQINYYNKVISAGFAIGYKSISSKHEEYSFGSIRVSP